MIVSLTPSLTFWDGHTVMLDVESVVHDIEARNTQALQQLYLLFGKQVFSVAYAVVQHRETAEEVTQDVFLKVWNKVEQYERGTNFKAWLLRITRNLAIDRLRRDKTDLNTTKIWIIEEIIGSSNFPSEDERWVKQALSSLSDEQRHAIELAFLYGMTHEQIASRLNAPLGTVKSRIRHGLMKLREAWEGELSS